MRNPPKQILCSFCNKAPEEEVVFRSRIGGEPPIICGECVLGYVREIVELADNFEKTSVVNSNARD